MPQFTFLKITRTIILHKLVSSSFAVDYLNYIFSDLRYKSLYIKTMSHALLFKYFLTIFPLSVAFYSGIKLKIIVLVY